MIIGNSINRKDLNMKTTMPFFWVMVLLIAGNINAEEFLEVPMIPDARIILESDDRLEMKSALPHEEIVTFYRDAMRAFPDIKFRDWPDAIYIEDDGKLEWHSITISKHPENGKISIVIVKDNWTWIIGTLILRYIGVFVVLLILYLFMSITGGIISRFVQKA